MRVGCRLLTCSLYRSAAAAVAAGALTCTLPAVCLIASQRLDVDYVLVIFGGLSGYSSDDINKFLWMVRIGGGVYPQHIQEKDYLTSQVKGGGATAAAAAADNMLGSMQYCAHECSGNARVFIAAE